MRLWFQVQLEVKVPSSGHAPPLVSEKHLSISSNDRTVFSGFCSYSLEFQKGFHQLAKTWCGKGFKQTKLRRKRTKQNRSGSDGKTRAKWPLGTGRLSTVSSTAVLAPEAHRPSAGDCQGPSCSQAPPQPHTVIPWSSSPAMIFLPRTLKHQQDRLCSSHNG